MKNYPYSFQIALDGNGINGLEGMAGVCNFLYNPTDNSYAYKIQYFNGVAGGHAVNVNPSRTCGYLGTSGQHIILYDPNGLEEIERVSTLMFEINDTTVRGSTHVVWLSDHDFITHVGDYFYQFDVNNLSKPEKLGAHKLMLPHAMKRTHSGRYICYGSMDNPALGKDGEAKMVGVWDLETGEATKIPLPATCWHVIPHPTKDLFYAVSFRVVPQDYVDYHQWGMAWLKEYAFEIDAAEKRITRHWVGGRQIPAHINSDVTISDTELIFCNGGSQTVVLINLENFADFRIIDEKPDLAQSIGSSRQIANQVFEAMTRGNIFTSTQHFLAAMRVTRFSFIDSIHACQLSDDQTLLFTANRGLNHITIYDYPSLKMRFRVNMPDIQGYTSTPKLADPRLGFHHSLLLSPNPVEPVVSDNLA
jgi:hypothetical protein